MHVVSLEEHLGLELKTLRTSVVTASKTLQYRMGLATKVEEVSDENTKQEESVESTAVRLALDKCSEALAIYSKSTLYSYFEASCSLRIATIYEQLGSSSGSSSSHLVSQPSSMSTLFERHSKVRKCIRRGTY